MKTYLKELVVVAIMFVLFSCCIRYFVIPDIVAIRKNSKLIQQYSLKVSNHKEFDELLTKLDKGSAVLSDKLLSLKKLTKSRSKNDMSSLIQYVYDLGWSVAGNKIYFESTKPQQPQKLGILTVIPITFQIKTNYSYLCEFIAELESNTLFFRVEAVAIDIVSDDELKVNILCKVFQFF